MSQTTKIINQLNLKGQISRNWCLQNYISRLSAIILNLKKNGWEFLAMNQDKDYVYMVTKRPQEAHTALKQVLPNYEVKMKNEELKREASKQANLFN